jgi:hypothetical protein
MTMNGIRPMRRSLSQSAMIRTRVGMAFEAAGHAVGEAKASQNTAAFFRLGARRHA